jgi:hypothetical protein
MTNRRLFVYCVVMMARSPGQDTAPPIRIWGADLSGSIRARIENWDWFKAPPAQSSYAYGAGILRIALARSYSWVDWQAEGAFPLYVNLPRNAVAPDPQGPLGYGGDYYLANRQQNIAAAVLRQAFVRFRSADARTTFRLGRLEFADGAEAVPRDPALAALKRDRINQRLIATFNYALRSFDGGQFNYTGNEWNVTAMVARVVEGSFQVRAFDEIDVALAYGAFTRQLASRRASSEARLFVLYYNDGRTVLKTDNRPSNALEADRQSIRLATPGAHWISMIRAGPGTADLLLWGAGQFGRWGSQQHVAGEVAAEIGYRFPVGIQPWVRAGYFRSTGDPNPADGQHNTFFQILSTPRAYARFPSYILMNVEDSFGQFRATPHRNVALRSELHFIRLSNSGDLWYDGGGAFQQGTFGYLGRPSGDRRAIGTALDLNADWTVSKKTTLSFYGGVMRGSAVPALVFPAGGQRPVVHLLSLELMRRF